MRLTAEKREVEQIVVALCCAVCVGFRISRCRHSGFRGRKSRIERPSTSMMDAGIVQGLSITDTGLHGPVSEYKDALVSVDPHDGPLSEQLQADIARHEHIERALRERADHLRLILDSSQIGVWEVDLKSGSVTVDDRGARLLGVSSTGRPMALRDLFHAVSPEDWSQIQADLQRTVAEGGRFERECPVQANGRLTAIAVRGGVTLDENGRASRLVGTVVDRTELEHEGVDVFIRARALESTLDGVLITTAEGPDYPIVYANPAFERLTGYFAGEVLGRNSRFLRGQLTEKKSVDEIRAGLKSGAGAHVTILNYRKDGSPFWNDVRITPLKDSSGVTTHFVGVQTDVTDRYRTEQTLKQSEASALAASEAKSEFLANMSHEIRTPLTAVLGCADTLFPRLEREEHREVLQMIRNQGRMLLGILNDILDLSKIEAGRLDIHEEDCSIISVISEVRSLLEPQADEKGIQLETAYATRMPALMLTDPLRVRQILMNLVGNAIKFTDTGSVTIVSRCDRSTNPPTLAIEVRDTGIGIPPELLNTVFEAFNQIQPALTRRIGGTGLGLTISQRLVRMLGGHIGVVSQVGQGTVFTVQLPITSSAPLLFEQAESLAEAADEQHRSRDSIDVMVPATVLVAEDTRGIQFMIRRMLEDAGATVAVVDNGERAVAEVLKAQQSGRPFDVVLMDMQMPVLTGFDATARLRAQGNKVPIIALTAAAMRGDREKCLQSGCDEYLSKPIDRHALLDAVARQYNRAAPQRAGFHSPDEHL
jgi:PAS domain S-box-containing protein